MTQDVGDRLERGPALHEPTRKGMAQHVGAGQACGQAAAQGGIADCAADGVRGCRGIVGRSVTNEQCSAHGVRSTCTQVGGNRASSRHRQRQHVGPPALATDPQSALAPIHILESQAHDLGGAQPQVDVTAGNRIVASAGRGAAVERAEKLLDLLRREVARQGAQSPLRDPR